MLKTTFTITALAMSAGVYAQHKDAAIGLRYPTQKGSILAGSDVLVSSIGFGSGGKDQSIFYNGGLSPNASYMITDNWAVGVTIQGNAAGNPGYRSHSFGAGVFTRYYFGKAVHKDGSMHRARFFAEVGVNYGTGTASFRDASLDWDRYKFNFLTAKAAIGANYFINKKVGIEYGMYYSTTEYRNYGGPILTNRNLFGARFGVQFHLGSKR